MRSTWIAVCILMSVVMLSCDDDPDNTAPVDMMDADDNNTVNNDNNTDNNTDNNLPDDAGNNNGEDTPPDVPRPDPGTPVAVDLDSYIEGAPNPNGAVRVFIAQSEDELVGGPAAQGQIGDIVMENERVRFVIEKDERVIGPCPFGGNIIDGDIVRPEGEPGQDAIGEVCQLMNAGRTLDPETIEILSDGSDGSAGVVAVTGHLEILDFINLIGLASTFIPVEGIEFSVDPDAELPITVTIYYVLRGGDQGVRVVTAMRNDGDETQHFPIAHLMDSGGDVEFFNPTSNYKGFGYGGSLDNINAISGERMIFLAFRGQQGSHAVMQDPVERLSANDPASGVYLAVSGVAVHLRGLDNIATALLTPRANVPDLPGLAHIAPGGVEEFAYWHFVGDGSLATMLDVAYDNLEYDTGAISGTVSDAEGGVAGVRVSATDAAGRTMNQALTNSEGRYSLRVPVGSYAIRLHGEGRVATPGAAEVSAGGEATVDLSVNTLSTISLTIRTPDGAPTAAKVVLFCDGPCAQELTAQDRDVTFDRQPTGANATFFTGVDGNLTINAVPGDYKLAVSRGPEWSVWPQDVKTSGGFAVTVAEGDALELQPEIARVVSSPGVVSADMHVHAINSPDSPTTKADRVRTFVSEGVDVLVSTDHDYITDFAPTIAELGAQDEVATVIGEEITTFDYGHYNAFPMDLDASKKNGGAVDWAGGVGPGMTPAEIFAAAKAQGGDRVIQINHPNSGYFKAVGADTLRGTTTTDPTRFRLPPIEPDPVTGDTGLWDEGFTAFEIYNGYGESRFWSIARWWLSMVGRGFHPTATSVSDTHKRIKDQAGGPRSLVQIGADFDTPATFTPEAFAAAVNQGRVIGTNGPTFSVTARTANGEGSVGDTIDATNSAAVTFEVNVDLPEWMDVDTIEVYSNIPVEDLEHGNADPESTPLTPTMVVPITFGQDALEVVATGELTHRHKTATVTFEMTFDADAYVFLIVRNKDGADASMFPIIHDNVRPFAFTNPIFVDADGGGYNNPPYAAAASNKREVDVNDKLVPAPGPARPMKEPEYRTLLQQIEALHGHGD